MPRLAVLLGLLILSTARPECFAADLRLAATTTWAENITRASATSDWRDAWRHELHGSLSTFRQWTAGLITVGRIDADIEHAPRYDLLDAVSAGIGLHARQKFGLGAYAPVATLDTGLRRREARHRGDDGWTATAALGLSKRFTSAWRASLTADRRSHFAREDNFYTRDRRLFATVSWDVTPRLQLTHGNGRLWGYFVANASSRVWSQALAGSLGPHISSYYRTIPQGVTGIFGPGWVTYQISGHVNFWWLELSPAIGRNTSLPLRFENRSAVNRAGVKYRQDLWSLQLLHRF